MYKRINEACDILEQFLLGALPLVSLLHEDLSKMHDEELERGTPDINLSSNEIVKLKQRLEPLIKQENDFGVAFAQLRNIMHIMWVKRKPTEEELQQEQAKEKQTTLQRMIKLMEQMTPEEKAKFKEGLK